MYCRGYQWAFDCFDDSSDAWSARSDAPDVSDFVIGPFAQGPFGWPKEHLKVFTDCVLVFTRHQPDVAQIMSLTVRAR